MLEMIALETRERSQLLDVTGQVQEVLRRLGASSGMCYVFVPHTTAGITINENADPTVRQDILEHLERAAPWRAGYSHSEGNAAAHIKASLLGSSVWVPVEGGRLTLGTWQGIYFAEFDGPRRRTLAVKFLAN
mgnify:CR=1 FL=1